MKTSLSWISLYTNISPLLKEKSINDLAHLYSIHTAEIDDIIPQNIEKIIIGKVVSCEKHPDSKKLSIVKVFLGDELGEEIILTGAPNIVNATYVPVAIVGAELGEGFVIGERKMAGMMSRGMICADDELGLVSERSDGIMILEEHWLTDELEKNIGNSFFDLSFDFPGIKGKTRKIPLRDTTFEIDNKFITNRPDLFSIIGNAREWGTIFEIDYKNPLSDSYNPLSEKSQKVTISSEKCLAYSLLETDNITVQNSPLAIKIMMERAGLKPKNNIVDITNLLLTEYGQPMHCFDADTIDGNISVRMAQKGEILEALNDEKYTLTENDLVIADESGPIALAGIIGGKRTAVSETTTRVFWESATFDATTIRLTTQRIALRTDASTRYEKSLDPILSQKTFGRVLEYLNFLNQKQNILSEFSYIDDTYFQKKTITVSYDFIEKKAGIPIEKEKIHTILESLGFIFEDKTENDFTIIIPSWRATKDISIKEDIAEEILRIYGYDKIPAISLSGKFTIQEKNQEKYLQNLLLQFFALNGWSEVYNYSFTNIDLEDKILSNKKDYLIAIQNAYTEDFTHMRSSLAPRLFVNIQENLRHSHNGLLQFFEIGKIYGKNLKNNKKMVQLLVSQDSIPYSEQLIIAGVSTIENLIDFRKNLEMLFQNILGFVPNIRQKISNESQIFHPGASGEYYHNDIILARLGKIHPQVAHSFEIPENTHYFEIYFEELFDIFTAKNTQFSPISVYQPISRELNFILPKNTETTIVAQEIEKVHPWISKVFVDSIFEDEQKVGKEKKSVNFAFTVQSPESTISDEQAKEIHENIISHIEQLGYPLRSI